MQQFLYDSMADIGTHLESLAQKHVAIFADDGLYSIYMSYHEYSLTSVEGIKALRTSQESACENLKNQTIVAALFVDAIASMLQLLVGGESNEQQSLFSITWTLWYIALVLSISSATSSLLALGWRQSL